MALTIGIADTRIVWSDEQAAKGSGPQLKLIHPQPTFYTIGATDDVAALFDRVIAELGASKIELLSIYAHGFGERDSKGVLHGGFGIELGKDNITIANAASLFARFKGKFLKPQLGIELVGCEVVQKSTVKVGNQVKVGDGVKLCQTIAAAAGTCVRASSSRQAFTITKDFTKVVQDPSAPLGRVSREFVEVEPGPWEGNVWLICAQGRHLLSDHGGRF